MLSTYPALFFKEKDGSYSVVFPDLNHLATDGRDLKEATEMAVDCLAGYLYMAKMEGEDVPPPTPMDKIDPHCEDFEDDDYESVNVQYISVDVEAYAETNFEKKVKKSVTIPKWVDEKAKKLGINFSEVLELSLKSVFKGRDIIESSRGIGKGVEREESISGGISAVGSPAFGACIGTAAGVAPILGVAACLLPSFTVKDSKKAVNNKEVTHNPVS